MGFFAAFLIKDFSCNEYSQAAFEYPYNELNTGDGMKMIILMRRNNIILVGLVFLLLLTIYSLNIDENKTVAVAKQQSEQKTVILDPGHGGEDPGAVSDYSGLKEKDANLDISLRVKELLEEEGYKVFMTREEDKLEYDLQTTNIVKKRLQDLTRRKKMIDDSGADIAVSIHLNKFPKTQYYGAQTFFPPNCLESKKLAESIQKSLREIVDPENKREALLKEEPVIIFRDLKTPTVMVECGFLSNKEEEKKLQTDEYRDKIAYAIKEGIASYYK
jgi:N-acetylmuramoyl-L-alanine amidase